MRAGGGAVEHLDHGGGSATSRERPEEGFKRAIARQPREPLPDGVPVTKRLGQRPPGDVMHREIMQRLQEAAVIRALLAASGAHLAEDVHHQGPGRLGHFR